LAIGNGTTAEECQWLIKRNDWIKKNMEYIRRNDRMSKTGTENEMFNGQ
jgi:signal recognition particle GTPase